jgi:hypothetical protein
MRHATSLPIAAEPFARLNVTIEFPGRTMHMLRAGMTDLDFHAGVLSNPFNKELLGRLATMGLRECHLTAGCLFQTIWNQLSGRAPDWGIKDYDIFYFDDQDLSWDAEDRVIRRVAEATADLPVQVEIKNQARVHLWYRERFGSDYPQPNPHARASTFT